MQKPFLTTRYGVLYDADCLEIMGKLNSGIMDCIFADPPFNLGKDYKSNFKDKISDEQYYEWCYLWLQECCRLLKPGGALFVYALPEIGIRFAAFLHSRLTFRHWIALTMKGTYHRGKRLYPAHYALLYYTRGEPKTFNKIRLPVPVCRHCGKEIKDYGGHRKKLNPEGLNLTDFWEDTSPNRHKKYKVREGVNELKPIIPERAILISTNTGDLVYDPFGGGGTTYQTAELHGRNWIGTELYDCHHIKTRLKERYPLFFGRTPNYDYMRLFQNENCTNQILRRLKRESL